MKECKMNLSELKPGEAGLVKTVGGAGALRRRLLDMGIIPGTQIKMLEPAPAGDPLVIHLRSFELSLRKEDAAKIEVSPLTVSLEGQRGGSCDCCAYRKSK